LLAFALAVFSALLLSGCMLTVNPQDLGQKQPGGQVGNTGANGSGSLGNGQAVMLTLAEVAKHNNASDCWVIFWSDVLDLSTFTNHPGGSAYVPYCGGNGTAAFEAVGHSSNADALMANYKVGTIGQAVNLANATVAKPPANFTRQYEDDEEEDDD